MDLCVAIDIGGTKLAAGLVTSGGELVLSSQAPTPRTDDPEELFAALAATVRAVLGSDVAPANGAGIGSRRGNVVACGVGCGRPMDLARGAVSLLNIPAWRDFPLRSRLEALTGLA